MSFLDPYTAVGIGTRVMPPVFVIDSSNQIYNLGPSRYARVNDLGCKTLATWFAGSSTDHSAKAIVTVRAATTQDFLDRGIAQKDIDSIPPVYLLEGWLDLAAKSGSTPQSIKAVIDKSIKCS